MSFKPQRHPTVLVIEANEYISAVVARSFRKASNTTYSLIRSSKNATALEQESIIPIIGSALDSEAIVSKLRCFTSTLDVIASNTKDNKNYI